MAETVHKVPTEYGEKFRDHLLEQYKVVRGRVVDIINDRNTQNKFLLTVLSAILAIPVVYLRTLPQQRDGFSFPLMLMMLAFPLVGALVSWHWIRWNRSFGEALGAGYKILKDIEKHLPAQPFTVEEEYRSEVAGGHHRKTTEFTILMARIFFFGNVIVALSVVVVLVWTR